MTRPAPKTDSPETPSPRYTFAFLMNNVDGKFQVQVWQAIQKAIETRGHNLVIFFGKSINRKWQFDYQENSIYTLVDESDFDGMIVATHMLSAFLGVREFADFLNSRYPSIPKVSLGVALDSIPSILVDNQTGMKQNVDHLIEVHRRAKIAFVTGPEGNVESNLRLEAYKTSLSEHGIEFDPNLVVGGNFVKYSGIDAMRTLVDERKADFDAVVCANDEMAFGALEFLKSRGIKVPKSVSLVGFDNHDQTNFTSPPITTVSQPVEKVAELAVETLIDSIEGRSTPAVLEVPALSLIKQSCGCLEFRDQHFDLDRIEVEKSGTLKESLSKSKSPIVRKMAEYLSPGTLRIDYWNAALDELFEEMIDDLSHRNESSWYAQLFNELASESIFERGERFDWERMHRFVVQTFLPVLETIEQRNDLDRIDDTIDRLLTSYKTRIEGHNWYNLDNVDMNKRALLTNLNGVVDLKEMMEIVANDIVNLDIKDCWINQFVDETIYRSDIDWEISKRSRNLLAIVDGTVLNSGPSDRYYPTLEIVPGGFRSISKRFSLGVRILYSRRTIHGAIVHGLQSQFEAVYIAAHQVVSTSLHTLELWNTRSKAEAELRQRSIELEEKNAQLSQLDNMKNDFIANITHDFRSPLTIILNNADLGMHNTSLDVQEIKRYKSIFDASFKLKSTIDRLLDLAKMDSQGLKLHVTTLRLRSFIEDLTDFYQSAFISTGIKIYCVAPVGEIERFYTDSEKLEEVLNNLLSNAIKFVDPQKGEVRIEIDDDDEAVRIAVVDNGIGIPPDKLETIFGRFEQIESGRNSQYKGTGIGLAFARQLTEFLHGTIHAESQGPGTGSRFVLEFPKGRDAFKPEEVFESSGNDERTRIQRPHSLLADVEVHGADTGIESSIRALNEDNEFDPKKALILIVDDNRGIRDIEREYLEGAGYLNFVFAQNGKQGVEAAFRFRPDIVVCDFNMPIMRGDEFHDELINNPDFKKIPFIFLTAITDKNLIVERKKKGAIAYLGKPIDPHDFLITFEIHLTKYLEYKETLQLATTDELTKLNNRRNLLKLLRDRLAVRSMRELSIVFFDIDHFKSFNDNFGHQAGDHVLATVGSIVKETIRSYDIAGRYGGEEFLLVLPETNFENAVFVAEKLRKTIEARTMAFNGILLNVTASFGVASLVYHEKQIAKDLGLSDLERIYEVSDSANADWKWIEEMKIRTMDTILRLADDALYHAKSSKCTQCGFKSDKESDFPLRRCPQCGSTETIEGRNQVQLFRTQAT